MKVVILCGGKGTRLRELTESLPKPLVEIGGKPILWHIMKIYAHYGFRDFILALGYKGKMIEEYFEKNPEPEWNIEFVDTGLTTNTGGRIKKIEGLIGSDTFMATYGDGVADIDVNRLVEFHNQKGTFATITCAKPVSQFGVTHIGKEDRVIGFKEKPLMKDWINGGFFVFEKSIFSYLEERHVLEKEPFEKLASEGKMVAYKHEGFWKCMDTFKDTQDLNELWANEAPWKVWK